MCVFIHNFTLCREVVLTKFKNCEEKVNSEFEHTYSVCILSSDFYFARYS